MAATRTMIYGSLVTIVSLFGGLLFGIIVGNIIFELTPGHSFQPLNPVQIVLAMESAGWVVGAPRAAERFTMLTVMFVGDLGAAMVGGAMMAQMIAKQARAIDPRAQRT